MRTAVAVIGILALLGGAAQAQPARQPLLELKAKSVSWGLTLPIPPVVNIVVGTLNPAQRQQLDGCVREQRLQPRNYRGLLLSWYYPSNPGHRLHVVRASDKYCAPFYGTNDFSYYLIDERSGGGRPPTFNLVLANHGDRMAILPKVTNGLNEVEAAGCNSGKCRIARLAFDGRRYRPASCEESEVRGRNEVRRPRRCGSDGFPDDQAPAPPPRPNRR